MLIAQILEKMLRFSAGNVHDMDHLVRVWTYARTIGQLEQLSPETQQLLEIAAITHDIACPLCREKYGAALGQYQEIEGAGMVRDFLADTDLSPETIDRISWVVGHHHTPDAMDGPDGQILIEADAIANALENGCRPEELEIMQKNLIKTAAGGQLLRDIFCL